MPGRSTPSSDLAARSRSSSTVVLPAIRKKSCDCNISQAMRIDIGSPPSDSSGSVTSATAESLLSPTSSGSVTRWQVDSINTRGSRDNSPPPTLIASL
ncbi:hypothetical protein KCU87_g547, partial [Aureobasidium melanogenum]